MLRARGHDAVTVLEQQIGGAKDPNLAQLCRDERRALITLDTDFADIRAYPPADSPGIVVLRLARQDKRRILEILESVASRFDDVSLAGTLWIVEEGGIRIRT